MTTLFVSVYICVWNFTPSDHNPYRQPSLVQTVASIDYDEESRETTIETANGAPDIKNGWVYAFSRGGQYVCD